jgi:hypothetical protein
MALQRLRIMFRRGRRVGVPCDPDAQEAAREILREHRHEADHIDSTDWRQIPELFARLSTRGPSRVALRFLILTAARSTPGRLIRFPKVAGDV